MDDPTEAVLPYRTTGEDLTRLVEARARGRDLSQIQTLNFSSGGFQGSMVAAQAFELMNPTNNELTRSGREYALASPDHKPELLMKALLTYEPYALLLEAIFSKGEPKDTPVKWIETWWGAHGYGNSQTNRSEGAASFGRILEFARLGSFTVGRRGLPTRIQWAPEASGRIRGALTDDGLQSAGDNELSVERGETDFSAPPSPFTSPIGELEQQRPPLIAEGTSALILSLAPNRVVDVRLPAQINAAEKQRLLALIDLMIVVSDEPETEHTDTAGERDHEGSE